MLREPKILIIGAGAAGISAACRLLENGLQNITILEAENRIGGRIYTRDFSENVVEFGAQWVHGERGNIAFDLGFPHKLLDSSRNINDFTKYIFVDARGEIVPQEQSTELLKVYYDINDRASNELKDSDISYGEYFINEFYKIFRKNSFTDKARVEQLLGWAQKFNNSINCSDTWFDVSAKGITEYWDCEGDLLLNWKDNGYSILFDLLTRKFPDPSKELPVLEKIVFGKEVSTIDYSITNEIVVKTNDDSEYTVSHVIFTPSLGVLKNQHSTMFVPPLPEMKQHTIKGLSIGTANKIFLEFPHRWWPEDSAGFSLIWSKEDESEFFKSNGQDSQWLCDVFQFFTVDYQPRVLCGWIVGLNAKYIETLSDTVILDGIYLLLETFLGKTYNIPRPDNMLRSKWYTNKHFCGSYSFRSMTSERMHVCAKDLAKPIIDSDNKPVILFAGEATHEHYFSTVHGAIESGFREADHLIEYHRALGSLKQSPKNFSKTESMQDLQGKSRETTKIVIVGAGIAGLAAAKTLEAENFKDYILLEAQEQIGGRIHSVSWNDDWIECGAQFLHGDKSKLAEFCRHYQLLIEHKYKSELEGQGAYLRNDGIQINQHLIKEIDDVVRNTLEECEVYVNIEFPCSKMENIGIVLRSRLQRYLRMNGEPEIIRNMKEEIFDWHVRFLMIDNSCLTLDELSVKSWGKFKFVGGCEYAMFKCGYNSLTKVIAKGLTQRNLRLNSPVETITWNQNINVDDAKESNIKPIIITLSDKKQIFADCVIVTCSLGYLKENHRKMFSPLLPLHMIQGIESLGFGLINKIFLDFEEPWWEPDTKGFQLLWSKNEETIFSEEKLATWTRDLTGFDVLQNHRGVLLGWVGGKGAHVIETLSEKQVANDCVNLLRYFLKSDNIPVAKRYKRTQWNMNKYVKGGYSHISVNCDAVGISPATLAKPVWSVGMHFGQKKLVPIIMLAGEATHDNFYSTTHGAYETGIKQAQTFLRYHVENKV